MNLHSRIGRLTTQSIRLIITNRHLVGYRKCTLLIHQPGRFMNQGSQHLASGLKIDQGELDRLITRQLFAEGLALLCIGHRLIYAILCRAKARSRLANPVLVKKVLHHLKASPLTTKNGVMGYTNVGKAHPCVIRGHIESPEILLDFDTRRIHRHQKRSNTMSIARLSR